MYPLQLNKFKVISWNISWGAMTGNKNSIGDGTAKYLAYNKCFLSNPNLVSISIELKQPSQKQREADYIFKKSLKHLISNSLISSVDESVSKRLLLDQILI